MELRVAVPEGFAFEATITSHGWYRLEPFHWDPSAGVLRTTQNLGDATVDIDIHFDGELAATCDADPSSMTTLEERMRRMFQLDVDLAPFHELCARSRTHRNIATARFGRLLCGSTVFEDAVKIICTTNTTWLQTVRMVENLVKRYGSASRSGLRAFPTPRALAAVSPDELQAVCRLGYRAKSIWSLATGIVRGEFPVETRPASQVTSQELFDSYKRLPGIGPYGAAHLLAMEGRHDFIAIDTEFRRFVRDRYHGGKKVPDATMARRYEKWKKWKYLAYWSELWSEPNMTSH